MRPVSPLSRPAVMSDSERLTVEQDLEGHRTRQRKLTRSRLRRFRRSSPAREIPRRRWRTSSAYQRAFPERRLLHLFDQAGPRHLVLAATVGLRQESVGKVSMRLNEGLTGLAAEQLRPIVVEEATKHPRFKYFPEAGEDSYHTFVGVPLLDQGVIQGVLVIQNREPRSFSREETQMLVVAANQIAPTVSEARDSGAVHRPCLRADLVAWPAILVELGPRRRIALPRPRSASLGATGSQPDRLVERNLDGRFRRRGRVGTFPMQASTMPIGGGRNIWLPTPRGPPPMREYSAPARSRIFRPSSGCTNRCRFIPADWESWRATISRVPATWEFRSWASACFTTRAISTSV